MHNGYLVHPDIWMLWAAIVWVPVSFAIMAWMQIQINRIGR